MAEQPNTIDAAIIKHLRETVGKEMDQVGKAYEVLAQKEEKMLVKGTFQSLYNLSPENKREIETQIDVINTSMVALTTALENRPFSKNKALLNPKALTEYALEEIIKPDLKSRNVSLDLIEKREKDIEDTDRESELTEKALKRQKDLSDKQRSTPNPNAVPGKRPIELPKPEDFGIPPLKPVPKRQPPVDGVPTDSNAYITQEGGFKPTPMPVQLTSGTPGKVRGE